MYLVRSKRISRRVETYTSVVTTSWVVLGGGEEAGTLVVATWEGVEAGELAGGEEAGELPDGSGAAELASGVVTGAGDPDDGGGGKGALVLLCTGATHLVQMVLVLVTKTVETCVSTWTEVVPA